MKASLLIILALLCTEVALSQGQVDQEEYRVYSAWLKKIFIQPDVKEIILMNVTLDHWTDFNSLYKSEQRELSKLQSSTKENYRHRNLTQLELTNDFDVATAVKFLPEKQWWDFRVQDPGAECNTNADSQIAFSRVGFNKKKDQALLHVHFKSKTTSLCSYGYFFLLSRKNGEWDLKQFVRSWEA